jgi:hypothetical protein
MARQTATMSLFDGEPALQWLPGETLYSLVSRLHLLWGRTRAASTTAILFGHPRRGAQHDLPSGLNDFEKRTDAVFGSAPELALERTLLRYYRAFVPCDHTWHAVACMNGHSVAHLKLKLGILTSRFRANHPLKACRQCMSEDQGELGSSYWHMEHQYPGVWICLRHGCLLQEAQLKSTGVERFGWHTPSTAQLMFPSLGAVNEQGTALLRRVACLTIRLVDAGWPHPWAAGRLQNTYWGAAMRSGWTTSRRAVDIPALAEHVAQHLVPLRQIDEFRALPTSAAEAGAQINRLLRPPRGSTHPIRHVVMIDALFRDFDSFIEAYEATDINGRGDNCAAPAAATPGAADKRRPQLVALLEEGLSITAAGAEIGIETATAMAWAAEAGYAVSRRAKKLNPVIRKKLIRALRSGAEKVDVASMGAVSVSTVTLLLRTEVGLHQTWTDARQAKAQREARGAWTAAVAQHPTLGVKYLRSVEPSAYAWLYRNDRAWLEAHKPKRVEAPKAERVRWDVRDEQLSLLVRRAALELRRERPAGRLKLWQLYQAVPDLKPKLPRLDRLPLTRRAIEAAIAKPPPRGSELL